MQVEEQIGVTHWLGPLESEPRSHPPLGKRPSHVHLSGGASTVLPAETSADLTRTGTGSLMLESGGGEDTTAAADDEAAEGDGAGGVGESMFDSMLGLSQAAVAARRAYFDALRELHTRLQATDTLRQYGGLLRCQLDNGDSHWFCPAHAAMASGRVDLNWRCAPCTVEETPNRSTCISTAEMLASRRVPWDGSVAHFRFDKCEWRFACERAVLPPSLPPTLPRCW